MDSWDYEKFNIFSSNFPSMNILKLKRYTYVNILLVDKGFNSHVQGQLLLTGLPYAGSTSYIVS